MQVDLTQVCRVESQVAGTQTPEAHIDGRDATVMVEISEDEHLQKRAMDGSQYRKEFESLRNDFNRLAGEARAQFRDTQYEIQCLKERVGSLEYELKGVTKKYEEVKSLSESRGKERVGSQVFLSKAADPLSISDVTQKIDTLNQEIYQAAASLADSIVRSKKNVASKEDVDHSKTLLGPSLVQILQETPGKSDKPVHPLLVQVTLQASFVQFCKKKIDQWTELESSTDQFLHTLYHEIRSSSTCKFPDIQPHEIDVSQASRLSLAIGVH